MLSLYNSNVALTHHTSTYVNVRKQSLHNEYILPGMDVRSRIGLFCMSVQIKLIEIIWDTSRKDDSWTDVAEEVVCL